MPRLRPTLGFAGLGFYAVGMILGAGIYTVIGAVAALAGTGLWISFTLGAAAALLTGLSYAELAAMFPEAGAEYFYLRRALADAPAISVVAGVVLVIARAATAATVALAFAGYLDQFLPVPEIWLALGLVAACTALNLFGLREATWVNVVFTLIEVGGLLIVIGAGLGTGRFARGALDPPEWGALRGAALVFFSYLGFENIASLSEEARRPARDIPRALLLSVAITAALYVMVALAVAALIDPERLAGSRSPLATAVAGVAPGLAAALGVIALFATSNTALVTLIVGSRLVFSMARGGDLPPLLGGAVSRRGAPRAAATAIGAAAAALLPFGDVGIVAGVASFGALLAFSAVNAALIVLRYRDPDRRRPFRLPLSWGRLPLLPLAGLLVSATLLTQFERTVYLAGLAAMAIGVGLAYARRLWGGATPGGSRGGATPESR